MVPTGTGLKQTMPDTQSEDSSRETTREVSREASRTLQRSFDTFGNKVDVSLEKLSQKVDHLIESVIRLSVNETNAKDVLEKQAAGLLDLANRQTLTDREVSKIIKDLAVLTQAVNDLKDSIQTEKLEMEKRTNTNRWAIGILFTAAASLNMLLSFVSQHIRP